MKSFPGAFVNFALESIGLEGILKIAENKKRGCEFRECLAYMDPSLSEPEYFLTHVRGELAYTERGSMEDKDYLWSELGLIFIPEGSEKTLAEMSHEEYLKWRTASREKNSPGKRLYEWISTHN